MKLDRKRSIIVDGIRGSVLRLLELVHSSVPTSLRLDLCSSLCISSRVSDSDKLGQGSRNPFNIGFTSFSPTAHQGHHFVEGQWAESIGNPVKKSVDKKLMVGGKMAIAFCKKSFVNIIKVPWQWLIEASKNSTFAAKIVQLEQHVLSVEHV
jgi:hypothetical protein